MNVNSHITSVNKASEERQENALEKLETGQEKFLEKLELSLNEETQYRVNALQHNLSLTLAATIIVVSGTLTATLFAVFKRN